MTFDLKLDNKAMVETRRELSRLYINQKLSDVEHQLVTALLMLLDHATEPKPMAIKPDQVPAQIIVRVKKVQRVLQQFERSAETFDLYYLEALLSLAEADLDLAHKELNTCIQQEVQSQRDLANKDVNQS